MVCHFVASAQSNARWGAGGVLQFVHKGAIKGKLPPTSTGQIFRKVKLFRKLHGICIIVRKSRESRNTLKVGARKGKKDLKTASIVERPSKDEIAIRLPSERKKRSIFQILFSVKRLIYHRRENSQSGIFKFFLEKHP